MYRTVLENELEKQRTAPSMTIRSTTKTVTFHRPFCLKGVDRELPPGDYRVVTEEELIEGLSFSAYHRVSTVIFVPAPSGSAVEMVNSTAMPIPVRSTMWSSPAANPSQAKSPFQTYGPDETRTGPLSEALENLCCALLEQEHAGWQDNDGAYGTFVFDVAARTIILECHVRYLA